MLILRKPQIDALGNQFKERFVRLMVAHLQEHFADRCATLGPAGVREAVIEGITKAEAFGIVAEQDVAGVLHFMFETTLSFDQAPGFAWAVLALKDDTLEPSERVDRLYTEWAALKPKPGTA